MRKIFTNTLIALSVSSCSSLPGYIAPTAGDLSRVEIEKSFNTPIPGSTTVINKYKMNNSRKCFQDMGIIDAKKFITVTDSNFLISEFNANGTKVRSGEELVLQITSISGPISCTDYVGFIPQKDSDYKIKLSGTLTSSQSKCKAELWSKQKNHVKYMKKKLTMFNVCK